jgi:antitoxin VapB
MSSTDANPKKQADGDRWQPRMAKLFKNGRSQAVRLPKEFRFEGTEVEIWRNPETGEVVLSPGSAQPVRTLQEWFDRFDAQEIPDDFLEREVHMPAERDLF